MSRITRSTILSTVSKQISAQISAQINGTMETVGKLICEVFLPTAIIIQACS